MLRGRLRIGESERAEHGPRAARVRPWLRRLAFVASLLALAVLAMGVAPAPAHAGLTDTIVGEIVDALLGGVQTQVGFWLAAWLTSLPNFAATEGSSIDELRQVTTALALGGLAAVVTIAVLRYYIAGLSLGGQGGLEALEGFGRVLLAVAMILIWPEFFRLIVALANSATFALLGHPSVHDNMQELWAAVTIGANLPGIALLVRIIVVVVSVLLLLYLLAMKIFLTAALALVYVALPMLLPWWAIPETAWLPQSTFRAFVVVLTVPLVWALVFAAFAALGSDYFNLREGEGVLDAVIIEPLVTITMLGLAIKVPKLLSRAALALAVSRDMPVTRGGLGFAGHFLSFSAAHLGLSAVRRHIPESLGGSRPAKAPTPQAPRTTPDGRLGGPAPSAATGATSVAQALSQSWRAQFGSTNATRAAPEAVAARRANTRALARERAANEEAARTAQQRGRPETIPNEQHHKDLTRRARQALGAFSPQGLATLAAQFRWDPDQFADMASRQAGSTALTPQHRDAFATLAEMPEEVVREQLMVMNGGQAWRDSEQLLRDWELEVMDAR